MKSIIVFILCAAFASSCFAAKVEKEYNKFTGISASYLNNIDIKTKEGVWIRFDLTRASRKGGKSDYFLSYCEASIHHFVLIPPTHNFSEGDDLWLTIDGELFKLKSGLMGANGSNIHIGNMTQKHVFLDEKLQNKIKKARNVRFEISKSNYVDTKLQSVSGVIAEKNLAQFRDFFRKG